MPSNRPLVRTLHALVLASLVLAPASAAAQLAETPAPHSSITAAAVLGNTVGGVGLQVQFDLDWEPLSVFLGGGYNPTLGDPELGAAAGLRLFTAPAERRGFLELSLSPIQLEETRIIPANFLDRTVYDQYYGPGIAVGLQRVFERGLTIYSSFGLGYAIGVPDDRNPFARTVGVGIGYTWR